MKYIKKKKSLIIKVYPRINTNFSVKWLKWVYDKPQIDEGGQWKGSLLIWDPFALKHFI